MHARESMSHAHCRNLFNLQYSNFLAQRKKDQERNQDLIAKANVTAFQKATACIEQKRVKEKEIVQMGSFIASTYTY